MNDDYVLNFDAETHVYTVNGERVDKAMLQACSQNGLDFSHYTANALYFNANRKFYKAQEVKNMVSILNKAGLLTQTRVLVKDFKEGSK